MPTVPNLVGLTVTDAVASRNAAGFTAGTLSAGLRPYTSLITDQYPAAGATADTGTAIDAIQAKPSPDGMIWGS